jgi:hypothetical protein
MLVCVDLKNIKSLFLHVGLLGAGSAGLGEIWVSQSTLTMRLVRHFEFIIGF